MEEAPFSIERSTVLAILSQFLSCFYFNSAFLVSKQVVWHQIDIILSLKNVAVWSSHAVMIFIENHFETYFCQVFIFKKILKNRNFDFLVPNAWQLQGKCIHPHPPAPEGKQQKHWKIKHYETGRYKSRTGSTRTTSLGRINSDRLGPTRIEEKNKNKIKVDSDQLGS